MTTRARLVFAGFVGLATYGYLRLSQRLYDAERYAKLNLNAAYGYRMQRSDDAVAVADRAD